MMITGIICVLLGICAAQVPIITSQVVESFAWSDPFRALPTPKGFEARCEAVQSFSATQHSLRDINETPPFGLAPWADAIKFFFGGRPFPGSWDGVDNQGVNRDIIMMEYTDVPVALKDWIKKHKEADETDDNRWLFAVYDKPREEGEKIGRLANLDDGEDKDKVLLFAAGSLYQVLPLLVAEGGACKGK
jgi:hypothetical protein